MLGNGLKASGVWYFLLIRKQSISIFAFPSLSNSYCNAAVALQSKPAGQRHLTFIIRKSRKAFPFEGEVESYKLQQATFHLIRPLRGQLHPQPQGEAFGGLAACANLQKAK